MRPGDDPGTELLNPSLKVFQTVDRTRFNVVSLLKESLLRNNISYGWVLDPIREVREKHVFTYILPALSKALSADPFIVARVIKRPPLNFSGCNPELDEGWVYPHHPKPHEFHRYTAYFTVLARMCILEELLVHLIPTVEIATHHKIVAMQESMLPLCTLFKNFYLSRKRFPYDPEVDALISSEELFTPSIGSALRFPDAYIKYSMLPDDDVKQFIQNVEFKGPALSPSIMKSLFPGVPTKEGVDQSLVFENHSPSAVVLKNLEKLGWDTDECSFILQEEFEEARKYIDELWEYKERRERYSSLSTRIYGLPDFDPSTMTILLTALVRVDLCYQFIRRVQAMALIVDMSSRTVLSGIGDTEVLETDKQPEADMYLFSTVDSLSQTSDRRHNNQKYAIEVAELILSLDSTMGVPLPPIVTDRHPAWEASLSTRCLQLLKKETIGSILDEVGVMHPLCMKMVSLLCKGQIDAAVAVLSSCTARIQAMILFAHEFSARGLVSAIKATDRLMSLMSVTEDRSAPDKKPPKSKTNSILRRFRGIIPWKYREFFFMLKRLAQTHLDLVHYMVTQQRFTDEQMSWTSSSSGDESGLSKVIGYDEFYPSPYRGVSEDTLPNHATFVGRVDFFSRKCGWNNPFMRLLHGSILGSSSSKGTIEDSTVTPSNSGMFALIKRIQDVCFTAMDRQFNIAVPFDYLIRHKIESDNRSLQDVADWCVVYKQFHRQMILRYALLQMDRVPALRHFVHESFTHFNNWPFLSMILLQDQVGLLASSVRTRPDLVDQLAPLLDKCKVMQPKDKDKSEVHVDRKPMEDIHALCEELIRTHYRNRDINFRLPQTQLDFAHHIIELFLDKRKNHGDVRPLEKMYAVIDEATVEKVRRLVQSKPPTHCYDPMDLEQIGLSRESCVALEHMQEHYCSQTPNNKVGTRLNDESINAHDRFLIYCFMSVYVQHASCYPVLIPDADFIASQIVACAQTLSKRPEELTEFDCVATLSTRRETVLSAFGVAAFGPRETCINPYTGEITDKRPEEKILRKRRQYVPTDLVRCSLLGKWLRFSKPFKTTRMFRPQTDGRNGKGGGARPNRLMYPQSTISKRIMDEEARQRVERSWNARPPSEYGIIPPPAPPPDSNKATLVNMQDALNQKNAEDTQLILMKIGETEGITRKPIRRRLGVSIPRTPPIVLHRYATDDQNTFAAKGHFKSFKKTMQLGYLPCCGNFSRITAWSWGPFENGIWCYACPNTDNMRCLMSVCFRCNALVHDHAQSYRVFDENTLTFISFHQCEACVRGSYNLFSKVDIPLHMGLVQASLMRQSMSPFDGYFGIDTTRLLSLHFVSSQLSALPQKRKRIFHPGDDEASPAKKLLKKNTMKATIKHKSGNIVPIKRRGRKPNEAGGGHKGGSLHPLLSKVSVGTV